MTKDNRSQVWIVLVAMACGMLLGILTAPKLERGYWNGNANSRELTQKRIEQIMYLIQQEYVDEVDCDSLSDAMLEAMMGTLDPHSSYLSAKQMKENMVRISGHIEGVGVVLSSYHDSVVARTVNAGGAAYAAGLLPGDRIVKVDTATVSGVKMPLDEVVDKIRGKHHTQVELTVVRHGAQAPIKYRLTRDKITLPTVTYQGMLDKETGYIRLSQFGENSRQEVHSALMELKQNGMKRLILDLRGNGGGSLEAALGIADEFLSEGHVIMYSEGAHLRKSTAKAHRGGLFEEGPMAVMIDEYSASASEIVAGALQDNDRATIVGRRSFGKGLVQEQIPLAGDAAVLLTIARYHTPSGRCIQRPYDKGNDEYYADFLNEVTANLLEDSSMMRIDDSTEYHTLSGRVVYGGGGIMPDHRLAYPKDTLLRYTHYLSNLVLNDAAMDYVSAHAGELLRRYPSEESFIKNFKVDNALFEDVLKRGEAKGIRRNPAAIAQYGNRLRTYIKGDIGDFLYGTSCYMKIVLPLDDEVSKSMKLIKN